MAALEDAAGVEPVLLDEPVEAAALALAPPLFF
jgi:hypothetical protein